MINDNCIRVTFYSNVDYANVLTEWSYALSKYTHVLSKSICEKRHPFSYEIQHNHDFATASQSELRSKIIPWVVASDYIIIGELPGISKKNLLGHIPQKYRKLMGKTKFCSFYYGTAYRKRFKRYNRFAKKTYSKRIYAPDLFRLSPKTKQKDYCFFPINNLLYEKNEKRIRELIDKKLSQPKLIILHCPSRAATKGTPHISSVVSSVLSNSKYSSRFVFVKPKRRMSHSKVMALMEKATIYIDQHNIAIGGFGVSSIESLSSGCLTFSTVNKLTPNTISSSVPITDISNPKKFRSRLVGHLNLTNAQLKKLLEEKFTMFMNGFTPRQLGEFFIRHILSK
jgi:hypothetical protein